MVRKFVDTHTALSGTTHSDPGLAGQPLVFTSLPSLPDELHDIGMEELRREASRESASRFYTVPEQSVAKRKPFSFPRFGEIVNPSDYLPVKRPSRQPGNTTSASGRSPDPFCLFRTPPPWSILEHVQKEIFQQVSSGAESSKRLRGDEDGRPQSSYTLVESEQARQSVRAVFGLVERRKGGDKPQHTTSRQFTTPDPKLNPFSRKYLEETFNLPSRNEAGRSPPAKPARKKRRVPEGAFVWPDELEPVPMKSTLVIPPRSTKPLRPVSSLPIPPYPFPSSGRTPAAAKRQGDTGSQSKPLSSAVQTKLQAFAPDKASSSRPDGAAFRSGMPGSAGSSSMGQRRKSAGDGAPPGGKEEKTSGTGKKPRKSTGSASSFDWKQWGS